MFDYQLLAALAAIDQKGSFEKASKSLGITSSAVSQRIKKLEEQMGSILIDRKHTRANLTAHGKALCQHYETVNLLEGDVIRDNQSLFKSQDLQFRTIKIAVNDDSLSSWFMDVLAEEAFSNDPFMLEIHIADQDYSMREMESGGVLAAITAERDAVQGFQSTFIGTQTYRATASHDYMRRYFPDGVSLQSIARAPALRYSSYDDLQTQWMQQVLGGSVPHNYHILPSSPGFVAACRRGVGWGMNPALMVDRHIANGDLVEIIPNKVLQKPLYWHCSRLIADPISRLTLRIITAGQKHLDQMR